MVEGSHFRRTARQPIELSVRFRRDADTAALISSGELVDLGLGGAQIRCERPPARGEALRILIAAPTSWDPLDLRGIVRWVDDGSFGVAFDTLSRAEASALSELLSVSRFGEPS